MRNYRFRVSHMIPNAWFYKLKHIAGRSLLDSKKKPPPPPPLTPKQPPPSSPPPQCCSRKSYYFPGEPPTKSSKQHRIRSSSTKPATRSHSPPESDIIINFVKYHDSLSDLIQLPPIITNQKKTPPTKKLPANSAGVKLRIHSPKIAHRKINQAATARKSVSRRTLSDSFAIVKSSYDPQKDFRESMVEMILENNISASKDLEDLLACYLSLNADEYHHLIIKVFKQIWFDLMLGNCKLKPSSISV